MWNEKQLNDAITDAFNRDVATYFPEEKREEKIDRLIELVLYLAIIKIQKDNESGKRQGN